MHHSRTSSSKAIFENMTSRHLGFMQLTRVAQSCVLATKLNL